MLYIQKNKPKHFRWHVAGDIPDQRYLCYMRAVALEFPRTNFLCFTKRGDLDYGTPADNLHIVFSQWPGMPIQGLPSFPRAWLAPDARIPDTAKRCAGSCFTCKLCFNLKGGQHVYFTKH